MPKPDFLSRSMVDRGVLHGPHDHCGPTGHFPLDFSSSMVDRRHFGGIYRSSQDFDGSEILVLSNQMAWSIAGLDLMVQGVIWMLIGVHSPI